MTNTTHEPSDRKLLDLDGLRNIHVEFPDTNQAFSIWMPENFDSLLDQAEADPEQNLPYWAELWPSGIALASFVLKHADELTGAPVIELGCGLGVTAIAAMRSGASLVATDYAPEALALCEVNCRANGESTPTLMQLNWRKPGQEYFTQVGKGVPLLLAADALYEERDIAPLLHLVRTTLAADGELWLAEPGRCPAARFIEQMSTFGWQSIGTTYKGLWPDPEDNRKGVVVTVHRISRMT